MDKNITEDQYTESNPDTDQNIDQPLQGPKGGVSSEQNADDIEFDPDMEDNQDKV